MDFTISPQLIAIAIEEVPAGIKAIKDLFVQRNPDLPVPTSAEVLAAHQIALVSTLAADDDFLAESDRLKAAATPPT